MNTTSQQPHELETYIAPNGKIMVILSRENKYTKLFDVVIHHSLAYVLEIIELKKINIDP